MDTTPNCMHNALYNEVSWDENCILMNNVLNDI